MALKIKAEAVVKKTNGKDCPYSVAVGIYAVNNNGEKKFVPLVNGFLGFDETHIEAASSPEQKFAMEQVVAIAKTLQDGETKDFVWDVPVEGGKMKLVLRIYKKKSAFKCIF